MPRQFWIDEDAADLALDVEDDRFDREMERRDRLEPAYTEQPTQRERAAHRSTR